MKSAAKRYVIWVLAASWLYAAAAYFGLGIRSGTAYMVMAIGYMWIPGVLALVFWRREGRRLRSVRLGIRPNRWFLFALLVFPVLQFASLAVALLGPGTSLDPTMSGFLLQYEGVIPPEQLEVMRRQVVETPLFHLFALLAQSLVAAVTINLAAALGEELGWRGYLHEKLIDRGFWRCSLLVGSVWGLWHAPLILQGHNYPQTPVAGVFLMLAWCLLLAPLFTLIRVRSRSIVAAGIAHGALNSTISISFIYLSGGHFLWNGFHNLSGFVVLALVNAVLFFRLRNTPPTAWQESQTLHP